MVRKKYDKRLTSNSSIITSSITACNNQMHKTIIIVNKLKKRLHKNHAIQEIKYLQKSTQLIIPKTAFARLVRQILFELFPNVKIERIQAIALEALQESAEMYVIQYFEDAVLLCLHTKRNTLMQKDMILLRRLRGRNDIINK